MRKTSHGTQCWVGPRMGPVLLRGLGAVRAGVVLKILGIENQAQGLYAPTEEVAPTFSRRGFIQLSSGIAAGIALAFGGGLRGPGEVKARSLPVAYPLADGSSMRRIFEEMLDSPDVNNVLTSPEKQNLTRANISRVAELGPEFIFAEYDREGFTKFDKITFSGIGYVLRLSGEEYSRVRIETMAIYLGPDDSRFLSFRTTVIGRQAPVQEAEVFQLHSNSTITSIAHSGGGIVSVPFPDGHDQQEHGPQPFQAFDPCGSCTAEPYYERGTCHTDDALSCVLSGVGCALCATTCYGLGPACLTCVIASCGGALRRCCQRQGGSICAACID